MTNRPERVRLLPAQPNRYTGADPLVVRAHPLRENRAAIIVAAVVVLIPLLMLALRAVRGLEPLIDASTRLALFIGLPLGVLLLWFSNRLSSGIVVTLTDTVLRRDIRRPQRASREIALSEISGALLASDVHYSRRRRGAELVVFLLDGGVLWLADGLLPDDVRLVAEGISEYGVKEIAEPIRNEHLRAMVRRLRREAGAAEDPEASA